MAKTHKITYKVFLFERVKKKVRFFDAETYPLQIRLTAGARTLYLKSNFFAQLQLNKYRQQAVFNGTRIAIADVIEAEENLLNFILNKEEVAISLESVRQEYGFLSQDILHQLDEQFKKFLVNFFYAEELPAYALFIKNDESNYTSEFILHNLEKSLQAAVFEKLLKTAVNQAPPYIPFINFFRKHVPHTLPLFPAYLWQEPVLQQFNQFVSIHFPEYSADQQLQYIHSLLEKTSPAPLHIA